MAAYLSLTNRETGETFTGGNLIELDAQICAAIGAEVDSVKWVHNWMDAIGFSLALGNSFERTREIFEKSPELLSILDYLEPNFTNDSYMAR